MWTSLDRRFLKSSKFQCNLKTKSKGAREVQELAPLSNQQFLKLRRTKRRQLRKLKRKERRKSKKFSRFKVNLQPAH